MNRRLHPEVQHEIEECSIEETHLSDFGKNIRLNRILRGPGKGSLVVAFDHAFVLGPIPGTRDAAAFSTALNEVQRGTEQRGPR